MSNRDPSLEVYKAGKLTVVGFAGDRSKLDELNLAALREDINELLQQHECEVFAVDLSGVTLLPSGLLGLLTSLRNQGLEVHLYNPTDEVREVLKITKLEPLFPIHEVEL